MGLKWKMGSCPARQAKRSSDVLLFVFTNINLKIPHKIEKVRKSNISDEVIGFITTLVYPGCADGSVSSSDRSPTDRIRRKDIVGKPQILKHILKNTKKDNKMPNIQIPY